MDWYWQALAVGTGRVEALAGGIHHQRRAAVSAHPLMSRSSDTGVLFCFEFGDSELIPDQAHIIAVIKIFIFKR